MLDPMCSGKHAYPNAAQAWRVIMRSAAHKRWFGRKCRVLDVYHCPLCGRWHIGKSFRSARAALRWEE